MTIVTENKDIAYDRLRSDSYQGFSGAIINYILKRHYKHIHYTSNIKPITKDNKENIVTMTGTLRSSKVGLSILR